MSARRAAALALAAPAAGGGLPQRVPIDAGWKFNRGWGTGPVPPKCAKSEFPTDYAGQACQRNLLSQHPEVADADSCRAVCCEQNQCASWFWCPVGATDCKPAGMCLMGMDRNCQKSPGWVGGGGRNTSQDPKPWPQSQASFDDSSWRDVDLPHDFIVEEDFTALADARHGYLPPSIGWYRKRVTVPAAWAGKRVWLQVDGTQRDAEVYINGALVAKHSSGYTSYNIDVAATAANLSFGGANLIAVKVNADHAMEGASVSWWYDGGGIYRHMWLQARENVHIVPWGVYVPAHVNTATIQATGAAGALVAAATVNPVTEVFNAQNVSATVDITSTIMLRGKQVGSVTTKGLAIPANSGGNFSQTIQLPAAQLWSLESPTLYTLHTEVSAGGSQLDSEDTTFGVRSLRFDKDHGFFLNEQATKVKGMCQHQDFAGVGVAVPDRLEAFRVAKLKEMGANAWRTAHNPPNKELLDACDQQGFLVWDENHRNSVGDQWDDDLKSLVRRDRNHPSVIMWSLCNEALCNGFKADNGAQLKGMIQALDPAGGRPVTAAMNGGYDGDFPSVLDVMGFNYHPSNYDDFHKSHPNQPIIGSETSSDYGDRGIYANNKTLGYVSAYDVNKPGWGNTAEDAWVPIAERDYVAGGFVWTGFDYKGEPTPYQWPNVNSHFGNIDIAGFPKDGFYYYQSVWGDSPMLHVFPHWNWNTTQCEGMCAVDASTGAQTVNVWAYSNADVVELFVNGASQGNRTNLKVTSPMGRSASRHVEWTVPYTPGTITAQGYMNGSAAVYARDARATTGPPARVVLAAEWPAGGGLRADGADVALVAVSVVDAGGRVVPTAAAAVSFALSGPARILGVGNGDPSCHEHDKPESPTRGARSTWNGLARVVLQSTAGAGAVTLSATAAGLAPASLTIHAA